MRAKDRYARRRDFNPATDTNFVEWPRPLPSFVVRMLRTFAVALMLAILVGLVLPDRGIGEFSHQVTIAGMWTVMLEQFRWLARLITQDIIRFRSGEAA